MHKFNARHMITAFVLTNTPDSTTINIILGLVSGNVILLEWMSKTVRILWEQRIADFDANSITTLTQTKRGSLDVYASSAGSIRHLKETSSVELINLNEKISNVLMLDEEVPTFLCSTLAGDVVLVSCNAEFNHSFSGLEKEVNSLQKDIAELKSSERWKKVSVSKMVEFSAVADFKYDVNQACYILNIKSNVVFDYILLSSQHPFSLEHIGKRGTFQLNRKSLQCVLDFTAGTRDAALKVRI